MTGLVLVRHGHPEAGWAADPDPGLDAVGRAQAEAMAEALADDGPRPLLVSPLRRTRETAAPLAARWGCVPTVEPGVGELPSHGPGLGDRATWLQDALAGTWADLAAEYRAWRGRVVGALLAAPARAVVVTHLVAINVAVGAATGDDRVACFWPDHCSRTAIEVVDGALRLLELGASGRTRVW